jgi:hypothetical protein
MTPWDEVVTSLNEQMDQIKTTLADGGVGDFSSYKELVGFYKGIAWARQDLTSILKKRFHDDEGE